jgi:UDP-N-acetylmuramoyl-tripeptide--D-alanyl-D-alanine ligase
VKPIPLSEFALAGGEFHGADPETLLTGFALDNRQVQKGDLFLAIKGARHDGHDFVPSALEKGAVAALVERPVKGPHLLVPDLVVSLAAFAKRRRQNFGGPVVGITGSNGKTTVKEMLAAMLAPLGKVLFSPGNRNSEYTSPLLWADLEADTKAVVVEMAMRGRHQISHLCEFALPQIGVITRIGTAHLEMLGSREGIADAKGEMFEALPADGVAVAWAEDDYLERLAAKAPGRPRTFGTIEEADCRLTDYEAIGWDKAMVAGHIDGREFRAELPMQGKHHALNFAAALITAVAAGVDLEQALEGFRGFTPPAMRSQVIENDGRTVLLDAYNASPESVREALRALTEGPATGRRIAVLGEMRELGDQTEMYHRELGRELAQAGVEALLIGKPMALAAEEALENGMSADKLRQVDELDLGLIEEQLKGLQPGDALLLKGSRALELERAMEAFR